ncbi:S-adenosyl-L-methionine-dependent methyltransferase [Sodiomyces alkalinus F11]|uniref:S-adenosyl-L-methionine-dependent methyltransferase n=1 Tax=Sodiomyces alkalinus (strain CBS 110278 / VKM F-3762 / F11) TaxID=1314773 RepID=A0A3N2PPS0_SODAK|nr:S-adenosyl-L-methionine-dependent methyltransferase [Sodiomyces alkalinus F11]ROT36501.1 S-adenosyl-L-methionine-dependent methyltransferase [Sodiomyces alkalinus F11]
MGSVSNNGEANGNSFDVAVALKAADPESVSSLASEIAALGSGSVEHDEARLKLLKKARSLVQALETPRETMIKHLWAQPTLSSALSIGVESGLFTLMVQKRGPSTVEELAESLKASPLLLARLLRHIAAMGYLKEVGEDKYEPNNFTKSLTIPIIGDGYPCILGSLVPAASSLTGYFLKNGYEPPSDPKAGPLQVYCNTEMNYFEYVQANPPWGKYFNHHMGGYRQGRPSWMDDGFFPVQERLIDGADTSSPESALLVDIGGSIGHDLDEFRRKYPDAPGRLVLQDLQRVLDQIVELDARIERVAYDFHTEQPVKGARAYYMHSVLHDWTDEVCGSILAQVTAAMKPGYSKLLINENVIPGTDADWQATALDLVMMTLFSSKERTDADWRRLLGKAGLKIVNIWGKGEGVESLIECELA